MVSPVMSLSRSTTPVTKPTTSRSAFGVDGGHLRGLAADERDAGFEASFAHAADEGFNDGWVGFVEAEVVEEGERPSAHDGDVAGNGGDEVATEVFVAAGHDGDFCFCADAVGALHHDRIGHAGDGIAQTEERAEGADARSAPRRSVCARCAT